MISIDIPEYKKIEAAHLVLDYNGTMAISGILIEGIKPILEMLSSKLIIHILTADTFETAKKELSGINCKLEVLSPGLQDMQKELYIFNLGEENVISIGNGMNDYLMLKAAALGIAVIQKEGTAIKALLNADIVCNSILDALELLLYPERIVATLRI